MKKNRLKPFLVIVLLIAVTGATMAYSSGRGKTLLSNWVSAVPQPRPPKSEILHISGNLVQNKILQGSDGLVNLSLIIRADDDFELNTRADRNVDMVIVLDRSGSMKGKKIKDARQAILNLLSRVLSSCGLGDYHTSFCTLKSFFLGLEGHSFVKI